jgi:hypothetical protein
MALNVEMGSGVGEWGKLFGDCFFCGPSLCLVIFLLLKRVLVLGIAGVWGCVELV